MQSKIVLITGVTSGLGRALAKYFMNRGCHVIGVARHLVDYEITCMVQADITEVEGRSKIAAAVTELGGGLDLLINNAGRGVYEFWAKEPEADLRQLFELNFFAPVELTKLLLPELQKNQGCIINISSAASRLYIPCMGPYCASKAALAMFSNSLRVELRSSTVHVIDFCPGQINTGFSSRSSGSLKVPDAPGRGNSSPEGLAECVYKAWRRRRAKSITYPKYIGPVMGILRGICPGFYERMVSKVWNLR